MASARGRCPESAARRRRGRGRSCASWPTCSRRIRRRRRSCLPLCPLHEMYAEPARDFIAGHGGEVRTSALARVHVSSGRLAGVEVRGERLTAGAVVAAVPWFGLRGLFGTSPPRELQAVLDAAAGMAAMPIVTVNLWYDRPVMQEVFAGLPGRTMQWVFDKRIAFGESASHLSLVSSGATDIVAKTNEELSALAAQRSRSVAAGGARSVADSRNRRAGEAGDVFAGARPAAASGHADRRRQPVPRRRLDRHGSACHDRGRGGQWESRGGRSVSRRPAELHDSRPSQEHHRTIRRQRGQEVFRSSKSS